jgi:dTDP-4-dehydrorhamnose reductase
MKILLFGGRGYLGGLFRTMYPDAVAPSVDIADAQAVRAVLDGEKPDVVINAAGKTGRPNVDWCETHREETFRSNMLGPTVLMDELGKRGIYWVHLGSGCIYEGDNGGRGFTEEDLPNFTGSYYSWTKNISDQMLSRAPNVLNLRLRMPFDGTTNPRNLLTKLRGYRRVLDVQNSITHLPDLLRVTRQLVERRATGTYNVVNDGAISPYEIMVRYRESVDPSHAFDRLALTDLPQVVKVSRSNCILSCEKLRREGLAMPTVEEALDTSFRALRGSVSVPQSV